MKTVECFRSRRFSSTAPAQSVCLGLFLSLAFMVLGDGVVTNCTEANLRAALSGGGLLTFACDGTITLENTITNLVDTVLDGGGYRVAISGGGCKRVFYLCTNTSLTLVRLTVSDGKGTEVGKPCPDMLGPGGAAVNDGGTLNLFDSTIANNFAGKGGAVLNQGGTLNLSNSTFTNNQATNGGAIFNQGGTVTASNSAFSGNLVQSPAFLPWSWTIEAHGGAILNAGGSVDLQDCVFAGNRAQGKSADEYSSAGTGGFGGAIENLGTLTVTRCTFLQNAASGGNGFDNHSTAGGSSTSGGSGTGGAIYSPGPLTVDRSSFLSNSATGGNGPSGGYGVRGNMVSPPGPGGYAGSGGSATGGAICVNDMGYAVNSTFAYNSAVGGVGGDGGGGGMADLHGISGANGGGGGAGGSAFGGLCGGIRLTNCTLAFNAANARNGGRGGSGGAGIPPGVNGLPGPNGSDGVAGGGMVGGLCVNSLLAGNTPAGNCSGGVADGRYNLSSDASCAFTNVGSLNNADPLLGLLTNNGGPTLTMALLSGSPAIDAGDTNTAPPTDQRGVPRPVGTGADIGAYEYGYPAALRILPAQGGGIAITVYGISGQTCRLLTSTNLSGWQPIATNQIGTDGTCLFQENGAVGESRRFYRVAIP